MRIINFIIAIAICAVFFFFIDLKFLIKFFREFSFYKFLKLFLFRIRENSFRHGLKDEEKKKK